MNGGEAMPIVADTRTVALGQRAVADLLAEADVTLDGDRPWGLRVHDPRLYRRILSGGSFALGEAYMDG